MTGEQKFVVFTPKSGIKHQASFLWYGVLGGLLAHRALDGRALSIQGDTMSLSAVMLEKTRSWTLSPSLRATRHDPDRKVIDGVERSQRRTLLVVFATASLLSLAFTPMAFDSWWARILGYPLIVLGVAFGIALLFGWGDDDRSSKGKVLFDLVGEPESSPPGHLVFWALPKEADRLTSFLRDRGIAVEERLLEDLPDRKERTP